MTDDALRHVVIVGGGTAGWLTAAIIAADHRAAFDDGLRVTLIESPNIPILGVGEGTWPSLRDTLRRIGVSETKFIRRCSASFKQGSRFNGWVTGDANDFYFHPFDAPPSADMVDSHKLWRSLANNNSFAEAVSYQPSLCLEGKAPKQVVTPEFAAVANYAYHLDAPALAELLRDHCTTNLGVRLVTDNVTNVERGDAGEIAALSTEENGAVIGDLYVDCTGSKALLVGEALGAKLTDVSDILFNDRALAVQAPYADDDEPIASQTNGTALKAGWVWDIALQKRRGVGYVYSSAHISDDEARDGLTAYLKQYAPASGVSGADARLIKFKSAYRETPWIRNTVAVGMSQGFVEPLEASAIVMVELSAMMISDTLPAHKAGLNAAGKRFNKRFAYRWSRIVDFLKLHYILSRRTDEFWSDHRNVETWPVRLRELIEQWKFEPPSREDFTDALEIFPAASYAYVLYGMGFETIARPVQRKKDDADTVQRHRQGIEYRTSKLLGGLPTNRELINHINSRGLTTV